MAEIQEIRPASIDKVSRRSFFRTLWMAIIAISLLEVAGVIIAFLTSGGRKAATYRRSPLKVLGRLEDFPNGSVTAFRSDRLYLVRMNDGGLLAVSLKCTHLGCAITWNEENGVFDCPCHASSFNLAGEVISPPAPRALDTYPLSIEGGMLKVDLSKPTHRSSYKKSQLIYA